MRVWFGKLLITIVILGYKQSNGNHILSFKNSDSGICILVYVSNIFLIVDNLGEIEPFNGELLVYIEIKWFGDNL